MNESLKIKQFVEQCTGHFSGNEEIVIDPQNGTTMAATATLSNTAVLGGMGIDSAYEQKMNGEVSIRCQTLLRFDPSGAVTMIWTPGEGEPAVYTGSLKGSLIDVSHRTDDGTVQRIRTDYADGSSVSNEMLIVPPDSTESMRVFSGQYKRQAATQGNEIWRDLTVPDADNLKDFYARVLGLTPQAFDMGDYSDFNMLDENGDVSCGICHAKGENAKLSPVWMPYFSVHCADKAREIAESCGGTVVDGPKTFDRYRYFALQDPSGASFVVCEQQ